MRSQRETLEDAIIDAIAEKLLLSRNPTTGYLGMVGEYNGELEPDEDALEDFKRRINGAFPAVLVGPGPSPMSSEGSTRKRFKREIMVELYVASNNLRSREHRNRTDPALDAGNTRDVGCYQIIEHLHGLIAGNDFGIDGVSPGDPVREEPLIQIDEFTIWRQVFRFAADAHTAPWDSGDGQKLTSYFLKSQIAGEPDDEPDVSPNPLVTALGGIPE